MNFVLFIFFFPFQIKGWSWCWSTATITVCSSSKIVFVEFLYLHLFLIFFLKKKLIIIRVKLISKKHIGTGKYQDVLSGNQYHCHVYYFFVSFYRNNNVVLLRMVLMFSNQTILVLFETNIKIFLCVNKYIFAYKFYFSILTEFRPMQAKHNRLDESWPRARFSNHQTTTERFVSFLLINYNKHT